MAAAIYFAPLRTPLIDATNGLMSRDWYLFFQALWIRSGGATNPGADDAFVTPDAVSTSSNAEAQIYADFVALSVSPQHQPVISTEAISAEVSELSAKVAELSKQIQDLKQGTVVL